MSTRKSKYTKEFLEPIVQLSTSYAGVFKQIGLKNNGGNYRYIVGKIKLHNISTSHFTGQAWTKGHTKETHNSLKSASAKKTKYSSVDILIENSPQTKPKQLRELMISNGIKYTCEYGHEPLWMNNPLTLHIDHRNGINNDNRLENLRFLCPNCHQQTATWGKRKTTLLE